MRRLVLCLLLAFLILGLLSACQSPPEPEEVTQPPSPPPAPTPVPTPSPMPTPATTPRPTPSPRPVPTILPEKLLQYADWIERNDAFCGWLTIPDTVMDYPVVYGSDYTFYIDYDFDKNKSAKGAVFVDYRNTPDNPLWKNTILYAHHMRNGSMFGSLEVFTQLEHLRDHPVFTYDTLYGVRRYQIFAVLIVPMNYNYVQVDFETGLAFLAFIRHMREISLYSTDLKITAEDEIITLSTCWYDFKDARFVVQGVRLPDEVDGIPAAYEKNTSRVIDW